MAPVPVIKFATQTHWAGYGGYGALQCTGLGIHGIHGEAACYVYSTAGCYGADGQSIVVQ